MTDRLDSNYDNVPQAPDFSDTNEPFILFEKWFEDAKAKEINDPNAMALATVDESGLPNVRMVLLKGFAADGFVFYTNFESAKGQELLGSGKAAPREQLLQRAALEQLAHQVGGLTVSADVEDRQEVRMLQPPDGAGLPLEPVQPVRIVGQLAWKDLDGDVSVELGVARPVDLSHAAGSDEAEDLEPPQSISGPQRHLPTPPVTRVRVRRPSWNWIPAFTSFEGTTRTTGNMNGGAACSAPGVKRSRERVTEDVEQRDNCEVAL